MNIIHIILSKRYIRPRGRSFTKKSIPSAALLLKSPFGAPLFYQKVHSERRSFTEKSIPSAQSKKW